MSLILCALAFLSAPSLPASPQDTSWVDLRFHRVHLRNGNFIDGQLVKDAPNLVTLRLANGGEIAIRRDQIDRVEFVKIRSVNEPAIVQTNPAGIKDPVDGGKIIGKVPETNTPEAIKKKVDMILFKFKQMQGEKEIPFKEVAALGEDAVVYLASTVPLFDLKTQEAMGGALINISNMRSSPKVNAVLEGFLTHESPTVRALAVTVLVASGGEPAKGRYLRPVLGDADPRVRETAMNLLGTVEDLEWFDVVSKLVGDVTKTVRNQAMRVTRAISTKNGVVNDFLRILTDNLNNPNEGVRADSAAMIGALGKKESWSSLATSLDDPEAVVRASAAQAIMNLGATESADSILGAMSREQDRWTRIYLAGAAQKLKLVKAVEFLIPWLSDPQDDIKKVAEGSLQVLTGENFGNDQAKWTAYWQSRGK
jgi:HEAT repeat protein